MMMMIQPNGLKGFTPWNFYVILLKIHFICTKTIDNHPSCMKIVILRGRFAFHNVHLLGIYQRKSNIKMEIHVGINGNWIVKYRKSLLRLSFRNVRTGFFIIRWYSGVRDLWQTITIKSFVKGFFFGYVWIALRFNIFTRKWSNTMHTFVC